MLGVKLSGVINQNLHDKVVKPIPKYSHLSKAPDAFGIDLHIDDLPGVGIECKNQKCKCIVLEPNDTDWVMKIKKQVGL